jgi:hypothetical protein
METFPDKELRTEYFLETAQWMYPNDTPWIAFEEGVLTQEQCVDILRFMFSEEEYQFPHCNARTRECPRPLNTIFDPIAQFLLQANEEFWNYKLDVASAGAWMQTYFPGDNYQAHMDGLIGQTRKLTAVAMLTDPSKYEGGDLEIYIPPNRFAVPNTIGSIVVFPHWVIHEVMPIKSGVRQTINLGFWGPPFR